MRRWVVRRYGGPERLKLEEASLPEPGQGQVRVAVRAIGLNFADLIERQGLYPRTPPVPFTPGMEVAGIVDAVGADVEPSLQGRRVMAVPIFGGHAEALCVDASRVLPAPEGASFEEVAAFPVAFLSAHYALHELGRAREGERLLVTAAAGGVGTALLQLARAAGVETMAVVGSPSKEPLVRELGAAAVSTYAACAADVRRRWGSLDLVVDSVAGRLFRPLWKSLAPGGRYVMYGLTSAASPGGISYLRAAASILSMGALFPFGVNNRTFASFNLSLVDNQIAMLRRSAAELSGLWERGQIRPIVGRTFPFGELPDAHRFLASRASVGKVVVTL